MARGGAGHGGASRAEAALVARGTRRRKSPLPLHALVEIVVRLGLGERIAVGTDLDLGLSWQTGAALLLTAVEIIKYPTLLFFLRSFHVAAKVT